MPPAAAENTLAGLIAVAPEAMDELLNNIDTPLAVVRDEKTGNNFLQCDYNRDADSYRSPWSNEYVPPLSDGLVPSPELRKLEIEANSIFNHYRQQYFGSGSSSSVYFFETGDEEDENSSSAAQGFGACWLVHKDVTASKTLKQGWWDSTHVFEVEPTESKGKFSYKLTSTIMISMVMKDAAFGAVDLSGTYAKQAAFEKKYDATVNTHVVNMGHILEDIETAIRNAIEGIYIQKTRGVINSMRSATNQRDKAWQDISKSLAMRMKK
jgi:capping protein beta